MAIVDRMTEDQSRKYKRFQFFYSDNVIKFYNNYLLSSFEDNMNEDFYESYQNIVTKTAKLIRELGITDPSCAAVVFEYLLWNGYLSKNKKLVYSPKNRINNPSVLGADIMRSRSVCLNNASMLTDVLNSMNLEAYLLGCEIDSKMGKVELQYKPKIKRKIVNSKTNIIEKLTTGVTDKFLIPLIGNHAFTLYRDRNTYRIVDPTNLAFLNFTDFLQAEFVGSDIKTTIKPYMMLLFNNVYDDKFRYIIDKTFSAIYKRELTVSDVMDICENSIELCTENSSLLDDFHDDNVYDIDVVCKKLKKIK